MAIQSQQPQQLSQQTGVTLIDVRSMAEFEECHAENATCLPLEQIDADQIRKMVGNNTPALICKSGVRASRAAEKLQNAFPEIIVVTGGTDAWVSAGLPVVRNSRRLPLQQQLFITVGSLVLTGVLLGSGFHPGWYTLSGMVGAGLIFAGLTGNCYLSLLLAKMPWNNRT